jgi:hypothetical protein
MNSEPTFCPTCNRLVPEAAEGGQAPLVACPSCGEPLTRGTLPLARSASKFPSGTALILGLLGVLCLASYRFSPFLAVFGVVFMVPTAALWIGYFRVRRSNAATGIFVLANMGVMAGLAVTFALWTISERREHDFKSKARRQQREVAPANATQFGALGYLPDGTNLVGLVDYSLAERTLAGRDFLTYFRLGNSIIGPAEISRWTGLEVNEIDHAVIGFKTTETFLPRLVLVAQARQSFDAMKVREKLKATRSSQVGSKTIYHFTPEKLVADLVIWFPAPDTVVVGVTRGDLELVPDVPIPDGGGLVGPLQRTLKEQVSPAAQTWVAGHTDDWQNLRPWIGLYLDDKARDNLASARDFAFSLQLRDDVKLEGTIACADASAAQKLQANLTKPGATLGALSPAYFQNVVREMATSLKVERTGEQITIRAQASAEVVRKAENP